jgi:hypothetical protein
VVAVVVVAHHLTAGVRECFSVAATTMLLLCTEQLFNSTVVRGAGDLSLLLLHVSRHRFNFS